MRVIRLVVLFGFVASFVYLLKPLLIGYYPDFSMHYFGTKAFFDHVSPYFGGEHFFIPHVYPPFTSVFFVPFMVFSYDTAEIVWVAASIVMYVLSILLLFGVFKRNMLRTLELFIFSVLNFTFFPLKFTLGMGQVNTFVLLCISLFLYFTVKRKNDIFAGNVIAFAIGMKLYPILLIPYLLLVKKWKILMSVALTMSSVIFLSLAFFGYEIHLFFLNEVLPSLTNGWKDYYYNQSISGFVSVILSEERNRQFFYTIGSAFFLIPALIILLLKRKKYLYSVSLILITSLLVNKFSWQHHYVLLIPSLFILFFTAKSRVVKILVGASYVLMAINIEYPLNFHPVIQFHALWGAVLLYVLTLYSLVFEKRKR